jgi:hypothetical protein
MNAAFINTASSILKNARRTREKRASLLSRERKLAALAVS